MEHAGGASLTWPPRVFRRTCLDVNFSVRGRKGHEFKGFPTLGPSVVEDVRQSKSDGIRMEHGWNTRGAQVHERQNMDGTRGGRKSDLGPPRVPSDVFGRKFQFSRQER